MSADGGAIVTSVNKIILTKYLDLPIPHGKIIATYIWIDGTDENLRSKDRTLDFIPNKPEQLPVWNFDGSSTGQAQGQEDSDVFLHPRAVYKDPFRRGQHILVMCDTYKHDGEPTKSNFRANCQMAHDLSIAQDPWVAIEQEYILLDKDRTPLGWPKNDTDLKIGQFYCGVGANKVVARDLIEAHYRCCLYAGIPISGTNAEVLLAQWEYQVGPSVGIAGGDDLWMSRYILYRLAEEFDIIVTFDPKPLQKWNGSGAHTNFSTKKMREENGIVEIEKAIEKLSKVHKEHIQVYDPRGGLDNARRLTGLHETASVDVFSSGVANRGCSIRIPRMVAEERKGYLEDRRPSSNCDPYSVINAILRTIPLASVKSNHFTDF